MLPEVQQDVDDRVADLARCRKGTRVVAIAPHLADSGEALHRQRNTNDKASDPARERRMAITFDYRVKVVLLHREMKHAKDPVVGDGD